jgi:hypothetical protein
VLQESYNKIAAYLIATFGANFILITILLLTTASFIYFIVLTYSITQMDKRYFIRKRFDHNKNLDNNASKDLQSMSINSNLSYVINIAKFFVGVCLVLGGLLMLVLPGQGLITILIGLSLIPFPGKNMMEQKLLSQNSVRSTLNWIRVKANKEPFIFD